MWLVASLCSAARDPDAWSKFSMGRHDGSACPLSLKECAYETQPKPIHGGLMDVAIYKPKQMFPASARLVAFSSFPHSGNSWLRALIATVTGLSTIDSNDFMKDPAARAALVKTHRSPTYMDPCPIYHNVSDANAVDPDALLHLVRNPLDTFFSLGVLRKSNKFNPARGYVWSRWNTWLDQCLQHMKFWTEVSWLFPVKDPSRLTALRLRYEDALADPHLAMRAILCFLWRAHRPEERRFFEHAFNATSLNAALQQLSCRNIDNFKCLTGGLANVGKYAGCFSPSAVMNVVTHFRPTLDLMGYEIKQQDECGCLTNCTCYCPLQLIIKRDRPYSGVVGPNGSIIESLQQLIDTTPIVYKIWWLAWSRRLLRSAPTSGRNGASTSSWRCWH